MIKCLIMNKVIITAVKKVLHGDLVAKYENPIQHACDVVEGMQWISVDGQCPDGLCPEAWKCMREFVRPFRGAKGISLTDG